MSTEGQDPDIDARVLARYVPVFFHPGWVRERYLGWTVEYEAPGFRVSSVRRGPVKRYLVLARGVPPEAAEKVLVARRVFQPFAMVSYHDFSVDADAPPPLLAGRQFRRTTAADRCVNVNTFVVDLTASEEEAWQRVRQNARGAWKKARSIGTTVSFTRAPTREQLDEFFSAYRRMASERGLLMPERSDIGRMVEGGSLVFAHCCDKEGRTLVINLIYIVGEWSYYFHGVATERSKGEGQFIQWETIKYLKDQGFRWYDLGGVASTDPKDGIFFFKRSMGGTFFPLGSEYSWVPRAVELALAIRRRVRRDLPNVLGMARRLRLRAGTRAQ